MNGSALNRYISEFVGTLFLVLMGCGSAVLNASHIGILGVSLSFGLTLLFLIYTLGPVSGCHLNPAVTLCLAFRKKFPTSDVIGYILFQCLGAIAGAFILYMIAKGKTGFSLDQGFALNGFGEHSPERYSMIACFITEVAMTALLLFAILSTTKSYYQGSFAGVAIGLTLAVIHMVSIPVTNTSVNFARSLGVAVVHGGWALNQLWLFAVSHIIAVVLVVFLFNVIHPCDKE